MEVSVPFHAPAALRLEIPELVFPSQESNRASYIVQPKP
jgi:hypothetical protein